MLNSADSARKSRHPRRPIRVLHCLPRVPKGGIYTVVKDLLSVFGNDPDLQMNVALIPQTNYAGDFPTGSLGTSSTTIRGNAAARFLQLYKLAQQHDLVHLHGFTPWVALAIWMARRRIIFTNHGLMGKGRRLRWYEHIKLFLLSVFLRHSVAMVVNISQYAAARLADVLRIRPEKMTIVYNCTRWHAEQPRITMAAPIVIGYHGSFVRVKRLDRLLSVAHLLKQQVPVHVQLLGDGPLRAQLQQQATTLGLDVTFIDYQQNIRPLLASVDVAVLPSQGETLGVAVLESIQAGIPTFVFADGAGCTEIFDEGSDWFVCHDEAEMAAKILLLRSGTEKDTVLLRLQGAQNRIAELFSPAAFHAGYKNIYCLVGGRRAGRQESQLVSELVTTVEETV